MKVLLINSVCGVGSTGRIVVDLYHMLESMGHTCFVAYGRGTSPEGIETIKIGAGQDILYHGLMSRIADRHGFYSNHATKEFIDRIKAINPDIIHLHNIHGYYINIPVLFQYLKESGKPVLWTLHDCWAFTGHCAYFDHAGCEKWKQGCCQCPQKGNYPKSLFIDHSSKNYIDKKEAFTSLSKLNFVVPSKWLMETVSHSFFKKYPCKVIYNGINLDNFRPAESDLRMTYGIENKKVILGVSNVWEERKGLSVFIALSKQLPDNYQIVLIGVKPKIKKHLPAKIIGITKTENVRELVKWYSAADIYFNASVEETMGMTTVEALACGTPVLTFNKTAVPEVVDQTCGIVLSSTEIGDICRVLTETNWEKYSAKACILRAQYFDKQKAEKEYLAAYEELV